MSTKYGRNQKWNVRPESRELIRRMFVDVLGAKAVAPNPKIDLYTLSDGCLVGVMEDADALDAAHARKGAWLELIVDDPDKTASDLAAAGIERIDYTDKEHPYFQAGASPVFRLARA
jgi:hypothetical protein